MCAYISAKKESLMRSSKKIRITLLFKNHRLGRNSERCHKNWPSLLMGTFYPPPPPQLFEQIFGNETFIVIQAKGTSV